MRVSGKLRTTISLVILGISILVWVVLLINPGEIMGVEHCRISYSGSCPASPQMMLEMNPMSSLLIGWGLMVLAMMLPKLILPIQYIYAYSLKRRRLSSSFLFILGYITVWMAAGVFMIATIVGLQLPIQNSYLPAIGIGIIAIIWQFSPIKQYFLNQGHNHRTLATFGWAANRDALLFGVMHGVWCVGSGWALMLLPMLLPQGHNIAMMIVTLIMVNEHLEHPQVPRWRMDFRWRLLRAIVAQTQIKIRQVQGFI